MSKRRKELENDEDTSLDFKRWKLEASPDQVSSVEKTERKRSTDDYTVGWICPLEVEQIAALEMLDEEHERLPQASTDHNVYNLGSIAGHDVVIAGLHQAGNNPAATVVTQMRMTFRNLRFGLLVGIGGGVPVKTDNGMIRLGDIVVSKPVGGYSGAVQYDHGKARDGKFERIGVLAPPPSVLLNAAQDLAAKRARSRTDPLESNIKRIDTSIRGLRRFRHPGPENDHLYEASYVHEKPGVSCDECGCDVSKRIRRPSDDDDDESYIVVHRGTIASGELVIKDANLRDRLAEELGLLCFEMEAAGALVDYPCLVVRGISDYCDTHKNDQWHGYAAAVAAAYARQLFFHMPKSEVQRYISETSEETISRIELRQLSQDRQRVLEWLSPTNFPIQQQDAIRRRHYGTAQWFLDSPEFQDWLRGPISTLFCPGIPGAGKTMMAAVAVEYLNNSMNSQGKGVAYVFCNFKSQVEQTATNLLAAILKQLVQTRPSAFRIVKNLHKQHTSKGTKPSIEDIYKALRDVLRDFPTVYIIVDALDECEGSARRELLSRLQDLTLQNEQKPRIMATSRSIPEIVESFSTAIKLEVHASREDIKHFVAGQIDRLPACIRRDSALKELLQDQIVESSGGMFLLARLHIASLADKRNARDVKSSLAKFSKSSAALDSAYSDALQRIEGQLDGDCRLAKKVLSWIVLAARPLTTDEICHALAVEPGDKDLDPEGISHVEDLITVCAGLVIVEEKSALIRLVHYTTQEFFERTMETWNPVGQLDIAKTCLTYLSFDVFKRPGVLIHRESPGKLLKYKLLEYAARHWAKHAETVEEDICELACTLLADLESTSFVAEAMYGVSGGLEGSGLHIIANFRLPAISRMLVSTLAKSNPALLGKKDDFGSAPLDIAVLRGNLEMVRLLLEAGADVAVDNGSALCDASERGYEEIVKLLLRAGADTNLGKKTYLHFREYVPPSRPRDNRWNDEPDALLLFNPELKLPHKAHEFVRIGYDLLETTHQIETRKTALYVGSRQGHEGIVKLLLDAGANVNIQCEGWRNALSAASSWDHKRIVKLLLDAGADVNATLYEASHGGHEFTVKYFLDADLLDKARADVFDDALCAAASRGYDAVVKLLLEANVINKVRGKQEVITLYMASYIHVQGEVNHEELRSASECGHEAVAKLLTEKSRHWKTTDTLNWKD